jgi:hypothetical protein
LDELRRCHNGAGARDGRPTAPSAEFPRRRRRASDPARDGGGTPGGPPPPRAAVRDDDDDENGIVVVVAGTDVGSSSHDAEEEPPGGSRDDSGVVPGGSAAAARRDAPPPPERRVEVLWHGGVPAGAIEDACAATTGECVRLAAAVVRERDADAAPRHRVEVVWHYGAGSGMSDARASRSATTAVARRRRPRINEDDDDDDGGGDGGGRRCRGPIALTDGERDGALLLAESFRVASSTFGLLADAVRFAGETAAATAGGASRLAGGAIRLSGWAVGGLGDAIANGGGDGGAGRGESVDDGGGGGGGERRKRSRRVAGTSVRLLAGAIEQLADSLLLAGSATEHVAFAAAGAAEGTVRIMEDAAASLSEMFSREGRRVANAIVPRTKAATGEVPNVIDSKMQPDVAGVAFSEDTNTPPENSNNPVRYETEGVGIEVMNFARSVSSWILGNADVVTADTVGVSSLAYEMLVVFLLCYLTSVVLLSSRDDRKRDLNTGKFHSPGIKDEEGVGRPNDIAFDGRRGTLADNHVTDDHDSQSTLTVESTMRVGPELSAGHNDRTLSARSSNLFFLLLMPLRLGRGIFALSWSIALSKGAILFVFHIVGWIYLSRVAQYKSSVIQR